MRSRRLDKVQRGLPFRNRLAGSNDKLMLKHRSPPMTNRNYTGVGSSLIDAGINKILGGDGGGDSGSGDRTGLLVAEAENCPDLFPMESIITFSSPSRQKRSPKPKKRTHQSSSSSSSSGSNHGQTGTYGYNQNPRPATHDASTSPRHHETEPMTRDDHFRDVEVRARDRPWEGGSDVSKTPSPTSFGGSEPSNPSSPELLGHGSPGSFGSGIESPGSPPRPIPAEQRQSGKRPWLVSLRDPKRPHRPTLDAKNRDEDIDDSAKKPRRPNGQDGDENPDDPVPGPSGLQADRRRGRPEDSPIRPEPQDGDQNPDHSPAPGSEEFKAFYAAHHPSQKAKQPPQGGDQNPDDPVPGPSGLQAPQDRRPQAQGGDNDPVPGPSGLQAKQPSTSGPLDVQGRPRNRGSSPSLREQLARDHPRADQLAYTSPTQAN
ncbi:unnamed protein product [Sphagnum tenellum]